MKRDFSIKFFNLSIFLLVLLFTPSHANPQEHIDKGYIVGPGDILNIQVWDHDDLNRVIEVSQDGTFSFPFIGKLNVYSKSIYEIEALLTGKLGQDYIVAPQIAVTVEQYHNKKVFLFGEVQRPGSYPLRGNISLLELISEAGGFKDNFGALGKIVRNRSAKSSSSPVSIADAKSHEIITIDLIRLTSGDAEENIQVLPGDSIYINAADHLFVTGEVRSPGEIKWSSGLTVRQAISMAGGGTPGASVKRTKIVRLKQGREVEITPNLSDPVYPNDIIKVPQSFF